MYKSVQGINLCKSEAKEIRDSKTHKVKLEMPKQNTKGDKKANSIIQTST